MGMLDPVHIHTHELLKGDVIQKPLINTSAPGLPMGSNTSMAFTSPVLTRMRFQCMLPMFQKNTSGLQGYVKSERAGASE